MKNCAYCKKPLDNTRNKYCNKECSDNSKVIKHFNSEGKLRCSCCGEYKDISSFDSDKRNAYRLEKANMCKSCVYTKKKKRIFNSGENLEQFIKHLLIGLNSTKRNKRFGKHNIDFKYIIDLYNKQNGLCAVSGLKMSCFIGQRGKINNNMSIDRLNNDIGYIKNNIQLVCFRVNIMKNNMELSELINYCKHIISNNE